MSLAAPWWLALLGLAPLIVALHLRRRSTHEVPTTWLWRSVADGFEPAPRWKRPPSTRALWLQLAAMVLAALAMAEPRVGSAGAEAPVIVVLDAGITMTVRDGAGDATRFDAAVTMLLEALSAGPERGWSVWWAGPRARPLVLDQHDPDIVARLLADVRPSHDRTDWHALARAVADDLDANTTVLVLSAAPRPSTGPLLAAVEASGAQLEWRSFTAPFDNLAVERPEVRREGPAGRWLVDALVRADGAVPARGEAPELIARFQPDGTTSSLEVGRAALAFSLGGQARTSFDLVLPGPGILSIELGEGDLVPADDSFVLRLDPGPSRPLVAVATTDASVSPTARALLALDTHDVLALRPGEPIPGDVDVLVVDGGADPFALGATALGLPPRSVLWLGTGPGVIDAAGLRTTDPAVSDWRVDHPLARGTAWGAVDLERAVRLAHPPGAEVVVAGLVGPLVSVRTIGGQRDVIVSLDPTDSTWTGSAAFPTFLADAIGWLAPPPPMTWSCTVGLPCLHPDGRVPRSVEHTADGTRWAWPAADHAAMPGAADRWFVPSRAGIWRREDGTPLPVHVGSAGAADVREASGVGVSEATPTFAAVGATERGLGWVRWTVLGVLALIVVEAVVAGRGDERFARVASWRGASRMARRHRGVVALLTVACAGLALASFGGPWPRAVDPRILLALSDAPTDAAPTQRDDRVPTRTLMVTVDDGFDLATALERALASVDPAADLRIVVDVASPPTRGDVVASLPVLAERGAVVDVRPPAGLPAGDVVVRSVALDRAPRAGDTALLHIIVVAERDTNARLTITRDGVVEVDSEVTLAPGTSVVRAPVRFEFAGRVELQVRLDAPDDPRPQNDAAGLLVDVAEAPVVHVFTSDDERGERFVEALTLQGLDARLRPTHAAPVRLDGYAGVGAVVLLNVAALDLTTLQQSVLEAYVRDAGGGVVITGGERAFGPGGYHQTVLDRLSPLAAQVPRDAPEVAMLFVLDRSGSMQQFVGNVTRLDIAKEAALAAIDLLGEQSQVGIVVFDEEASVLLPFVASDDRATIEAALAPLVPGGGTAIHPGLVLAAGLLEEVEAATKHVIVMTDGLSQPGDYPGAVHALRDLEATVSAVAIGVGADVEAIQQLASLGGGMAHVTTDFAALPGILAQEAMMLAGDPIVEDVVVPRRTSVDSELMTGLPDRLPPLTAFVETSAKAVADVLLEDDEGRPLLASWRYGSGRVVAFGSHAVGPWADTWTALEAFPRWWAQWVRWVGQSAVDDAFSGVVHVIGDEAWVRIDAPPTTVAAALAVGFEAELRPLDDTSPAHLPTVPLRRALQETTPGHFEARLPLGIGRWEVVVRPFASTEAVLTLPVRHAFAARYGTPATYADDARLVARATGGRLLLGGEPAYPEPAQRRWVLDTAAWRPWLLVAIAMWLVTLVVRYAPGWIERLVLRILPRVERSTPPPESGSTASRARAR